MKTWMMTKKLVLVLLAVISLAGLAISCASVAQPQGWSGAAAVDGDLFLASTSGKLVSVDAATHTRLWPDVVFETTPPAKVLGCSAGATKVAVYTTPLAANGLVYIAGYNGRVYAFDAASGKQQWIYPAQGAIRPVVGGVVAASGKVYFGASDGKVYALDATTGSEVWVSKAGDKVWSTPVVAGGTLYVGSFDRKLYALDANSGKPKWSQPFSTGGAVVAKTVVDNNLVYVASFDRQVYAVDALTARQTWQFPTMTDKINRPGGWFWADPILYDGTLYAANMDGKVYVLDAGTGRLKVDPIDLKSPIVSSPVVVGSLVIIASENGKIYKLDTGTNVVSDLASVSGTVDAPLSASTGTLYVHSLLPETLCAVDLATGATLWSVALTS